MTREVVERLDLDMTPEELGRRISVTAEENTRILQLNYVDTDPERAALILNEVLKVAAEQIKAIMKLNLVSAAYEAAVPTAPSSLNAVQYAVLAALVGAVVSLGVLSVKFVMDESIRSEEDVERCLGLSTLAVVPASAELGTARKTGSGTGRK